MPGRPATVAPTTRPAERQENSPSELLDWPQTAPAEPFRQGDSNQELASAQVGGGRSGSLHRYTLPKVSPERLVR
jgi:hypothetical protein